MSTRETLLNTVRALEPIIRQHADEAERERRLSTAVAVAMRDAGLYRMWRPKALGGLEVDPMTAFHVVEEIAWIDSAAAWNLQIANAIETFGGWFPESAQEVFGDPEAIPAGAFNPVRQAVPCDGGYRVTGRTPFVSGAHQARWFIGLANIVDEGQPRLGPDGMPLQLMTVCRANEAQIIDNWNTLGMCGTGSHDVVMTDVFVPASRAVPFVPIETPGEAYRGPLYRLTIWPAIAALAPSATGIAGAAIKEFVEVAKKKVPAYVTKTLRDRGVVQSQIAQAEAKLEAARAYLYATFEELWAEAQAGRWITMQGKMKAQLATTHAILASAEAVDLVHAAVGASGIRQEQPFQKHFRDVHVITQHGFTNASKYESIGQWMMGLDPEWPFFAF